ncbi:hypothetical protein [Rufibacter radiotolerans]|nr:hypothetical protein [Rufibacter radiotolerans]
MGWEQTYEEKRVPLVVGFLLGEAMFALVSTPGFAKNGAYWSAASQHVMSLGSFNGGNWAENDQTRWVSFGMLNALATHHYFVKPTSGASVFWRNFIGLNMVGLTSHLVDKAISKRKARRS